MKIAVPKELYPGEKRAPLIPISAANLIKMGAEIEIESKMGIGSGYADAEYQKAGATITGDRKNLIAAADLILRLRKPAVEEIGWMKKGAIHISNLNVFEEREILDRFLAQETSAISMELLPRITRAQKMDVLSSQASLAGYVAVILAAEKLDKVFPMMVTPAGSIAPSRVFVIGAGVAGLQAIATAKRLGARVEAFDTRPIVEEQVHSLGARFVKVDLGETGETKNGYARALSEDQMQHQRDVMARHCAQADIVITTAQVFGKKAPVIITRQMVQGMKPGSVIVDMAVESGGNVEGVELNKEIMLNEVWILGYENLAGRVPVHASQMYSSNLENLISEFWNKENKSFQLNLDDEIMKSCLVTHQGKICSESLKTFVER